MGGGQESDTVAGSHAKPICKTLMQKSADAFRTISEVADDLSLPQHVLRFWETRFPQIRPLKRAGGRRYYRPGDVVLLRTIRQLLYDDGYTIKGVQRLLKEQGAKGLNAAPPIVADLTTGAEFDIESGETGLPGSAALDEAGVLLMATDGSSLTDGQRDAIEAALATVEECKRILDALRGAPA